MVYFLHLLGLVLVFGISVCTAWWVRRTTDEDAGTVMLGLLVVQATMAVFAAAQLVSPSVAGKTAWAQLWYALGLVVPICWFLLAVYYTGREHWLSRPVWVVLVGSSAVPLTVWLTDFYHGLGIADVRVYTDPFLHVQLVYTDLAFFLTGVVNVYTIFAFGLFLRELLFTRRSNRRQAATVLGGMLTIWLTTAISDGSFVPAPGFPYAVYSGGVFGALVAWELFRTRAVAPPAREVTFETVGDAIIVLDAEGHIVDFNAVAANRFPALDRRVNDRLDDVYPELFDTGVDSAVDAAMNGGSDVDAAASTPDSTDVERPFGDTVEVTRDGERRILRSNVSEIDGRRGSRGYVLVLRDVTELETYAAELERKTEKLEQFAGVLSHDLRNPVSVANGYLELAEETGDPAHMREARVAIERIDETIDDLLTLSRQGDSIDDLEDVSLYRAAIGAWETSATDDTALENEVDPGVRIRADPSRLRTVFENLFRNVADHGGETVRVAVRGVEEGADAGEGRIGFVVEDDGPGIPAEERERIFEYGYTSGDGTGLGLAIVRSIVEAHGWTLTVTEGEWGGARFEVGDVERSSSVRTGGESDRSVSIVD